ncbi:copper resistance protein (plasmid) [Escherichia coli]|nr:copper resistance protein [Escherichia coli]
MSIKNDGHYFCRAGGNRPDGLNEPVTLLVVYVTGRHAGFNKIPAGL